MSLNAAQIRFLMGKGLTLDEVIEFMELPCFAAGDPTNAERQARYRARRDVSVEEWEALRAQVFARDGHGCTYCGSSENLHCDHIIPLIQGGKSVLENLTTACRSCNCGKSGRTPGEWLGGD